jgi:hypothetical protein
MTINGYELALEQAKNEHSEIRVKIDELLSRSEMIEKLLECLKALVPQHEALEMPMNTTEHHSGEGHGNEAHYN